LRGSHGVCEPASPSPRGCLGPCETVRAERVGGGGYGPPMRTAVVSASGVRISVDAPDRRRERMRGLIGRDSDRGLLLTVTRSVHTFGMRRAIDAVLLAPDGSVIDVVRLPPRRILLPRRRVRHVLELYRSPFRPGDRLTIEFVRQDSHRAPRSP
jgi:uncharacterized membrane protein (UPF0127 family)